MSTAARITTNRPTTTQENFHIPRFALPSFIIRVPTGQGAGCGVMISVFCQPLPAQSGQCLSNPVLASYLNSGHGGHGLDGCWTKAFPWPRGSNNREGLGRRGKRRSRRRRHTSQGHTGSLLWAFPLVGQRFGRRLRARSERFNALGELKSVIRLPFQSLDLKHNRA